MPGLREAPNTNSLKEADYLDFLKGEVVLPLLCNSPPSADYRTDERRRRVQSISFGRFKEDFEARNQVDSNWYAMLEEQHAYIQWWFPTTGLARHGIRNRPVLDQQFFADFRAKPDVTVQANLKQALIMMADFYGFGWEEEESRFFGIKKDDYFLVRLRHLLAHPHNYARITRMIESLRLFGLDVLAQAWANALCTHVIPWANMLRGFSLPEKTIRAWEAAATKTMDGVASLKFPYDWSKHVSWLGARSWHGLPWLLVGLALSLPVALVGALVASALPSTAFVQHVLAQMGVHAVGLQLALAPMFMTLGLVVLPMLMLYGLLTWLEMRNYPWTYKHPKCRGMLRAARLGCLMAPLLWLGLATTLSTSPFGWPILLAVLALPVLLGILHPLIVQKPLTRLAIFIGAPSPSGRFKSFLIHSLGFFGVDHLAYRAAIKNRNATSGPKGANGPGEGSTANQVVTRLGGGGQARDGDLASPLHGLLQRMDGQPNVDPAARHALLKAHAYGVTLQQWGQFLIDVAGRGESEWVQSILTLRLEGERSSPVCQSIDRQCFVQAMRAAIGGG